MKLSALTFAAAFAILGQAAFAQQPTPAPRHHNHKGENPEAAANNPARQQPRAWQPPANAMPRNVQRTYGNPSAPAMPRSQFSPGAWRNRSNAVEADRAAAIARRNRFGLRPTTAEQPDFTRFQPTAPSNPTGTQQANLPDPTQRGHWNGRTGDGRDRTGNWAGRDRTNGDRNWRNREPNGDRNWGHGGTNSDRNDWHHRGGGGVAGRNGAWTGRGDFHDAYRRYDRHHHNRDWWHRNHTRIILINRGYYYWDAGWWYPAWGYDPLYSSYAYDGPIYAYGDMAPDEIVSEVQEALRAEGYYFGAVDGELGPLTRQALAAWQRDHGLAITTVIDEPTVRSLGL